MIIPKCIRENMPCDKHIDGKFTHWLCGEKYSPKDRHKLWEEKKIITAHKCSLCKINIVYLNSTQCKKCGAIQNGKNRLGKKLPKWWIDNMRLGQGRGVDNKNWGGDNVDYNTIHHGIRRYNGNPKKCEHCGLKGSRPNGKWTIHWANISGKYSRSIKDYIGLCVKCHKKQEQEIRNKKWHWELGKMVKV